jgi:hypothetical protein
MVLEWYIAFWLFLFIGISLFLFLRIYINRKLKVRYKYEIEYREEFLFSTQSALLFLYLFLSIYTVYLLWHNSQTIYLVGKRSSIEHKVGLFTSTVKLKNGDVIDIGKGEEVIVNNTEEEIVYEVVEYWVEQAIIAEQNSYPRRKIESRAFIKTISPYSAYDCSRIGVEYFFRDAPPLERKADYGNSLPFGNRDEALLNLYGWIRAKNVEYKRPTTEWAVD